MLHNSALLVIGPPTSAFLITSPPINAHPSPPLSTIDLTFVAIDDSFIIVDDEYAPHEVLPKSQFLEEELDDVNQGGHRAKKHLQVWVKKTFDEWRKIWGYNIERSIVDLSKDKDIVMELVDMLSLFILMVAKKMAIVPSN